MASVSKTGIPSFTKPARQARSKPKEPVETSFEGDSVLIGEDDAADLPRVLQSLGAMAGTSLFRRTPKNEKLDRRLFQFCSGDSELRELVSDPGLYLDLEKMKAFALHPKIQEFLASKPELKQIVDEEAAKFRQFVLSLLSGGNSKNGDTSH